MSGCKQQHEAQPCRLLHISPVPANSLVGAARWDGCPSSETITGGHQWSSDTFCASLAPNLAHFSLPQSQPLAMLRLADPGRPEPTLKKAENWAVGLVSAPAFNVVTGRPLLTTTAGHQSATSDGCGRRRRHTSDIGQTMASSAPSPAPADSNPPSAAVPTTDRNAQRRICESDIITASQRGHLASSQFPGEVGLQKRAFRDHCELSLLTEVLSWRRTVRQAPCALAASWQQLWHWLLPLLLLLLLLPGVRGSESPERECCENPAYNFQDEARGVSTPPPATSLTYSPPEEPDMLPEVPELPGMFSPTPTSSSLGCLLARQLCIEDSTCNQILQVIPRVCGMEQVVCSTVTVSKCQAALRTLRSFPFFNPTCLCKAPTQEDHQCNDFSELLFDHPCMQVKPAAEDPFPVDALPYCTHAQDVCNSDKECKDKVVTFQRACKTQDTTCVMEDVDECHTAWQNLRQSPIFGCICLTGMPNKKRCDQIFEIVNGNACIDAQIPDGIRPAFTNLAEATKFWEFWYRGLPGAVLAGHKGHGAGQEAMFEHKKRTTPRRQADQRTTRDVAEIYSSTPWNIPSSADREFTGPRQPTQSDQELINLKSTCHLALDSCERDAACRPYLESIKSRCVDSCSRERCMSAVQEFYRKVPRQHALDVAFCLCKKQNDDQCYRAQSLLHPICAQSPTAWSQREEDLPACHELANECRKGGSCRGRLERYEQACAVDAKTKTCAGAYEGCRSAMLDILGTELRTNCACKGSAGDFRKLFDCIGYQRLFWVNPCIVDAQKDYHLKLGHTEGPTQVWAQPTEGNQPGGWPQPTEAPPTRFIPPPTLPPIVRTPPPPPPRPEPPLPTLGPSSRIPTPTLPPRRSTEVPTRPPPTTSYEYPFPPTIPPTWPTLPTMSTRKPAKRTRAPGGFGGPTEKSSTSTTTTTTLPPKYCNIENPGNNVKYIREGFEKRLYSENKEGSELCSCKQGSRLDCTFLQEIEKKPCNTGMAFYSHASPFYLAYRGQCLCYSGQFICAKPDQSKGSKKDKTIVPDSPPGVYLYLGYSRIDAEVLKQGRMKLNDEVPLTEEEEELEVKNTIQQTVSHFTSNTNKSDCRVRLEARIGENYILKATLDEFDEYRMKKNMSDYMKYKEKEECFEALESIAQKVNERDADMRSHIILSMFKVAAAEANVPDPPPSLAAPLSPDATFYLLIGLTAFHCVHTRTLQHL